MIRKTLVAVHNTPTSKHMCKICGAFIYDSTSFNGVNVDRHLSMHFSGIVIQSSYDCYMQINGKEYGASHVIDVIPQLLYISPVAGSDFAKSISKSVNCAKEEIFSMGYTSSGSMAAIFNRYKLFEYKSQIMDTISTTQFKCSMITNEHEITCGQLYECGLPAIDLVIQHLSSHFI